MTGIILNQECTMQVANAVVLITGANRGIGLAFAREALSRGARRIYAASVIVRAGFDGYIVGRLGPEALAGVAVVLPLAMLMLQMSAGGLGGSTTSVIARALGAGDTHEATRLAQHALLLGIAASLLFTLLFSSPAA